MIKRPPIPEAARRRGGVTLLELMVSMAIIGIVLGIGAAMFAASRKDAALRAAHAEWIGRLRYARAQALVRRAPARVRADASRQRLDVLLDGTFGLWHGEDRETTGAFGFNGRMLGADLDLGKIGYAFKFAGTGSVVVDRLAVPAGLDALSVEAWVYPDDASVRQSVFEKKGEFALAVEGDGTLTARVGTASIRVTDRRLAPEQWSHLRVLAEDGRAVLHLNGREIGDAPLAKLPAPGPAPLVIGAAGDRGERDGFHGLIDEVAVRGRAVEESSTFDPSIGWTIAGGVADAPPRKGTTLYLTDQGRLDPARHAGPVTVTLTGGAEKRVFRVGLTGNVEP